MRKKIRKTINRSGNATCPICKHPEILEEHHINGRDVPNADHLSNLASICSNCHTKIHLGRIVLEGWIQTTQGKELFWHESSDDSFTGIDAKPYIIPG